MTDPRLNSLVDRFEALQERGQPLTAAELCQGCPELLAALEERLALLGQLEPLLRRGPDRGPLAPPPQVSVLGLTPGQEPVPGYGLVRVLGRGGFGEVWQAQGPGGFAVALKLLPQGAAPAAAERRALDVMKAVRHGHLLTVYGVWETPAFLVLAMELADGTLADRLREATHRGAAGLPPADVHPWIRQAAEGLDFLNRDQQVQHRDVKPQNLLLVGGVLKVGDFGLARPLAQSSASQSGGLTVAYAAPEVFAGRVSRATDQYSLAVTYCQLRGGRLPFAGSAAEILEGHLRRRPDLTMLPPAERPAVARALAKKPADRWPSCTAFAEAVIRGDPGPRWHRRRWLWWVAGAGAVGAAGLWWARRPRPRRVRVFEWPEKVSISTPVRCLVVEDSSLEWFVLGNLDDNHNATVNGRPVVWDVVTGRILRTLPVSGGPAAAVANRYLSHNYLVTGSNYGQIHVWEKATGHLRQTITLADTKRSISSVALSADGKRILSASTDNLVRLWDRLKGAELLTLTGHGGFAMAAAFLDGDRQAVSAGFDGTIRNWDLGTGKELRPPLNHHGGVWGMAVSADGRLAATTGNTEATVYVWDLKAWRERYHLDDMATAGDRVRGVAFDGAGRRLAVTTYDGDVYILAAATGRELWRLDLNQRQVHAVAFVPLSGQLQTTEGESGQLLLIGGAGFLEMWEVPHE